jgi:uncharacterized OsmC-like protein
MSTQTTPTPLPDVMADIQANPEHGKLTVGATGMLMDGVRCHADIREHALTIDEPMGIGGTDAGPNPVEVVLAALGTCQAITYRVWAAVLGVELDEVRFETEGDIDLNGFFGLRDDVRPGFGAIRHRVILVGPEDPARYLELADAVDRHCPVLDIVANPVPVERVIETRKH